jgi:hypothetical protein
MEEIMRNFFAFFVIAVAIMFTVACDNGISPVDNTNITDNDVSEPKPFTIRGAVAKGPLVKGSALYFTILSEIGEQEGLILNATTDDDLGRFSYKVTADVSPKVVDKVCKISATGYFYDEIGDRLSNAPVTLEALFRITDTEVQDARINLLTHMTVKRTLELMSDGTMVFEDAQAQAESELIAEMGVFYAPSDEDPKKKAIEMDLTKDPYPLAIACIFGQSAYNIAKDSDEFYGKYQQLLNDTAADLSDGTLTDKTKGIIVAGEQTLDADACAANLKKYLEEKTGEVQNMPDPNESIDTNKDGVPNVSDPDIDGDGIINEMDCVKGTTDYTLINVLRDILCVKKDNVWGCFYHDEGHSFLKSETDTTTTSAWTNSFNKVANGINHLCGIDTDQKLWSWSSWETPIKVDDTIWKDVFAGQNRTCAIDIFDQLYCWQDNLAIAGIKVNDDTDWSSVSLGNDKFYAIKADGTLWSWNFEEVPVQIGTDLWKFISNTSLYAVKTDGTLWYISNFTTPIQIGNDADWETVYGTCAVKTDNTLWCWNDGDKTPATKIDPVGWSCGEWNIISHHYHEIEGELLCGLKTDGSLWCLKNEDLIYIENLPLE